MTKKNNWGFKKTKENNVQKGNANIEHNDLNNNLKKEITNNRRSLKLSDYGNDVNELIKILIKKKKLSVIYKDRILFDKNVEQALKKLQKEFLGEVIDD